MIRQSSLMAFAMLLGLASASEAQIIGGHTFGGFAGSPVYTYQEPLAARPAPAPVFNGYAAEPVLSARTVTSAGTWPEGVSQPPAPINYATIGPNRQQFFGWNSFWWYDPSQGSPIWNPYNRGQY